MFTLGHLRNRGRREIFPIGYSNQEIIELQGQPLYTNTITTRTNQANGSRSYIVEGEQYARENKIIVVGNLDLPGRHESACRVYDTQGISPSLTKCEGGGLQHKIMVQPCLTPNRINKRQNGRRFKEDGEPMFTLTKQDIHGVELEGKRIRRLTPKECWRLQGIPDSITDKVQQAGISDTQMYRAAGDACSVNVIYEIAKRF